jgi:Common central domain of tyrosinase
MRFRPLLTLVGLGCLVLSGTSLAQIPGVVPQVDDIEVRILLSQPPHLNVTARGTVPTTGFTDVRLIPATYASPPVDRIHDFFLVATPPSGFAAQVITEIEASVTIERYTETIPWVAGIRVHGLDGGVQTEMLGTGLHIRRNILDLSPAEIETFKQGVAAMKNRPLNDRTSWAFQANTHGENTPANDPLWNQCAHGTLHFLTWHRAYLLEFEKILRDASGDPGFALPYWDWTASRSLPAAFRDPASPLFDGSRSINGGQLLPTSVVVDDLAFSISRIPFAQFSNSFEGSPHGAVHVLIGGRMGSVPTAANDPIFWMHHCNIDRIWEAWLAQGGGRANPTDPAFLNRQYVLATAGGGTVTHVAGGLFDTGVLGYQYDHVTPGGPAPLAITGPAVEANVMAMAAQDVIVASSMPEGEAAPVQADQRLGLEPFRVELGLRADSRPALVATAAAAAPDSEQRLVVEITGLDAAAAPRFTYSVYLNLPEGAMDPERMRLHRVGTINLFGIEQEHPAEGEPVGSEAAPPANRGGHHGQRTPPGQPPGEAPHAAEAGHDDLSTQRFDATEVVASLREAGL